MTRIYDEMFEKEKYEKQHLIYLHKVVEYEIANLNPIYRNNLKRTVNKYIDNHKHTKHINELQKLISLYEAI